MNAVSQNRQKKKWKCSQLVHQRLEYHGRTAHVPAVTNLILVSRALRFVMVGNRESSGDENDVSLHKAVGSDVLNRAGNLHVRVKN